MSEVARSAVGAVKRSRFGPVLAWLLFVRFPLLTALLFVALPFLATGPLSPLLGNLFLLGKSGLFGVTLLALLLGKSLLLATRTASSSGPIRLLPARTERGEVALRTFAEQQEIGFALAWDPDGPLAKTLARWDEAIAVGLALPTIGVAFAASCEPTPGLEAAAWPLYKGIAVGAAVLAYLLLRGLILLVERWFENPDERSANPPREAGSRRGPLARFESRALGTAPPAIARRLRRLAVRLLRLPTLGVGYVRERTADEALREYSRRRAAGESEESIRAADDPTLRFDLLPGHGAALAFFVLIFTGYLLLGIANYPGWVEPWFPTLGYVLILLLGIGWALAALSFWLDRFRLPVITLGIAASILIARTAGSDHFFSLIEPPRRVDARSAESASGPGDLASGPPRPGPAAAPGSLSPDERLLVDRIREQCRRPIVAVAAAGGGITSAAWTASMLTRLAEHESGGEFLAALRIVSGVSGGSVGTMFFLDGISERAASSGGGDGRTDRPLAAERGAAIRQAASAPGLDAVGWGLAYPDLARSLLSPLVDATMPLVDRSWALERTWASRLESAARERGEANPTAPTLRGWREATLAGELPAAILNATTVESGERFQMSTLRLTSGYGRSDFWEAYPGYDLAIATAARLSATFPFVSTAARARGCCGGVRPGAHFVDGGYFDNSGLLSALELLDRILGDLHEGGSCTPPVVIVRLEPFNEKAPTIAQIEPSSGWKSAIVSPIQTLLAVRTATQVYRNNWESGIFAEKWRGRDFQVHEIQLPLGGLGPLSWKLSAGEIARIDQVALDALRSTDALRLFGLLEGHGAVLPEAGQATADAAARSELGPMKAP